MSQTVHGALIVIKINGKIYNECQAASWTMGNSIKKIYGVDSPVPMEIIETTDGVSGSLSGVTLNFSGGLQGIEAIPLATAFFSAPYISIRIYNRFTAESLLFIPKAVIGDRSYSVAARGILRVSFNFEGIAGFEVLDEV